MLRFHEMASIFNFHQMIIILGFCSLGIWWVFIFLFMRLLGNWNKTFAFKLFLLQLAEKFMKLLKKLACFHFTTCVINYGEQLKCSSNGLFSFFRTFRSGEQNRGVLFSLLCVRSTRRTLIEKQLVGGRIPKCCLPTAVPTAWHLTERAAACPTLVHHKYTYYTHGVG